MEGNSRDDGSDRRFVLASAVRPEDARRTAAELPEPDRPCRHEPDGARPAGGGERRGKPLGLHPRGAAPRPARLG
jgi:hypothetical protein